MAQEPDKHLSLLHNDVLIRSVIEYRDALALIDQFEDAHGSLHHVDAIRQTLALLETELHQRGIDIVDYLPRDGRD